LAKKTDVQTRNNDAEERKSAFQALTTKRQLFVLKYLEGYNATKAYLEAGYRPVAARSCASRLLTNANIQAAIREMHEAHGVGAEPVRMAVAKIALGSDISDFEEYLSGEKTLSQLRDEGADTSLIHRAVETTRELVDGRKTTRREIRMYDRLTALGLLVRVLGLVFEGRTHSGKIEGNGEAGKQFFSDESLKAMSEDELKRLAYALRPVRPDQDDLALRPMRSDHED
jgi:phage terminase small subunit